MIQQTVALSILDKEKEPAVTHQETIIPNKARDLSKQQALNNIECVLGF